MNDLRAALLRERGEKRARQVGEGERGGGERPGSREGGERETVVGLCQAQEGQKVLRT